MPLSSIFLVPGDKVNLDIFWLKDESLEDSADLPDPDVLAVEIAEELEAVPEQFAANRGGLETVIASSRLYASHRLKLSGRCLQTLSPGDDQ